VNALEKQSKDSKKKEEKTITAVNVDGATPAVIADMP
jgi:hypothetical protein